MAVNTVRDVVLAELEGRERTTEWVKNINQTTVQGTWYDVTGSSGNPRAKQWFDASPLVAQQIKQSTDGGIYHGSNVSADGYNKYLRSLRLQCVSATPLPMPVILCDYLLYYPSIDDGNPDPQVMDNTAPLPRYADGDGVQMMAVTISARTGGQSFVVEYTNSDGVSGRVTPAVQQNVASAPGSITTSGNLFVGSPFLPLQDGDTGVRSVQSVTMLGADTGFFALVLVKPLAYSMLRGNDAVYEKDLLVLGADIPEVKDDAYLSLVVMPNGSLSGVALRGNLISIWG